jgi:hypothetical protein
VAEACRTFGVSSTRYYEWKSLADRHGHEALMPKDRRNPQLQLLRTSCKPMDPKGHCHCSGTLFSEIQSGDCQLLYFLQEG